MSADFERTRWLQMLYDGGKIWMETSSPSEIRREAERYPDRPVYRLYKRGESEYERRPITSEELDADCAYEAEWYRKALEARGSTP